jgi:outer membrane lipoprotein-sorting protein
VSVTVILCAGRAAVERTSPARRIAAGLVLLVVAALPAIADAAGGVPLPRLRPQAAGAQATVAPETDQAPASPFQRLFQPKKAPPPVAGSRFTPAQQAALFNITGYLNSFRTMQGQFIQFGPHGEQSEGVFYIARPGKIRFHYSPPVKLDVIADGKNVAVRDTRAMTQDFYPLSKTPLRYLLAEDIDLTSDRLVREVREEPDLIAVVIVEKAAFVDGKLTMVFDKRTFELKQWIVTDAQGLNTSVAIYSTTTGKQPDPALFKINFFEMRKP